MDKRIYDLQMFAEGDGEPDGAGGEPDGGDTGGDKPISFDDFLQNKEHQAEFDRRVNKAIQTAVSNAEDKWKALADDKLTEAEKLAKMTKEEKLEYKIKKGEDRIAELEREKARGEMTSTARSLLKDENISIPDEMLVHLIQDDAEKTKSSVEAFSKLYAAAVQEGVKAALKGKVPDKGGTNKMTKEEIMKISDALERQRAIAENIQLFQ